MIGGTTVPGESAAIRRTRNESRICMRNHLPLKYPPPSRLEYSERADRAAKIRASSEYLKTALGALIVSYNRRPINVVPGMVFKSSRWLMFSIHTFLPESCGQPAIRFGHIPGPDDSAVVQSADCTIFVGKSRLSNSVSRAVLHEDDMPAVCSAAGDQPAMLSTIENREGRLSRCT